MAKTVALDELHITLRTPSDLPNARAEEIGRSFRSTDFMNRLRRATRNVVQADPELNIVRVLLTR